MPEAGVVLFSLDPRVTDNFGTIVYGSRPALCGTVRYSEICHLAVLPKESVIGLDRLVHTSLNRSITGDLSTIIYRSRESVHAAQCIGQMDLCAPVPQHGLPI